MKNTIVWVLALSVSMSCGVEMAAQPVPPRAVSLGEMCDVLVTASCMRSRSCGVSITQDACVSITRGFCCGATAEGQIPCTRLSAGMYSHEAINDWTLACQAGYVAITCADHATPGVLPAACLRMLR